MDRFPSLIYVPFLVGKPGPQNGPFFDRACIQNQNPAKCYLEVDGLSGFETYGNRFFGVDFPLVGAHQPTTSPLHLQLTLKTDHFLCSMVEFFLQIP